MKGNKQEGINYNETFVLVIILATIQDVIVVTTQKWWKIKHLNLKMTFLH